MCGSATLALLAGIAVAASLAAASSPAAGDLDPSYGTNGAVLDDFYGTQDPDQANAVAIQPDGKIVTAGDTGTGGFSPVAMVGRYNPNGTRDSTFGPPPHGFMKEQVCFSGTCAQAEADAVALMGNGDIVVAGVAVNNGCFFVMRLTPTGALDSTFAGGAGNGAGVAAFRPGGVTTGYHVGGVAVQSDGKVVVDGTFNSPAQGFIARVPSTGGGTLDATWNALGYTTEASLTSLSGLALQPADGKAVAVGADSSTGELLIARFTTAGAQDTTTFHSPNGFNETKIGSGPDAGAGVVATSDGRLIVSGTDRTGSNAGVGLFQFKQSDGSLDTTFAGGAGQERVALPGGDGGNVTSLALDSTGRLLVAGQDTTKSHTFVARFSSSGAADSSFGSGGFSIPSIGTSDGAQAVTADASNNPVVAGFGTPVGAPDTDAMTARLLGATPPAPPTTTSTPTSTPTTPTSTPTTTPTTPTRPPTTGKAKVLSASVHGTKALVVMTCVGNGQSRCSTTLKLSVTETLRGKKVIAIAAATHKRRTKKKIVVVGTGALTFSGGQRKTVTISLNRVGTRLLVHRHKLTVTLTVTQGRTVIYRHKLTIKKPQPKPRKHTR